MALIDDVVRAYHLDGSGSTVTDASGNLDGTSTGTTSVAGHINNARDFSGSSQKIDLTTAVMFPSQGHRTMNFWIKADNTNDCSLFIMENQNGYTRLNVISGKFVFRQWDSGSTFHEAISTTSVSTTDFQMVTLTWDGTDMKIYVNAVLEDTTAFPASWLLTVSRATTLGARHDNTDNFNGKMDETVFWTVAQIQTEIDKLYASGPGLAYPFAIATLRQIKIAGTFQEKPILTKVAGVFVDKPIKIKIGGTFQDA